MRYLTLSVVVEKVFFHPATLSRVPLNIHFLEQINSSAHKNSIMAWHPAVRRMLESKYVGCKNGKRTRHDLGQQTEEKRRTVLDAGNECTGVE
jgi:hypothetical protein